MVLNKGDELEIIYRKANSMYENKEYEEALNLYLDILKSDFEFFCRKDCIKMVQFCFRYLNFRQDNIKDTLMPCSDRSSSCILSIRETVHSASFNVHEIANDFHQVLLLNFDDAKIVDIWLSAFVCLIESVSCNVIVNNDIISNNNNNIENTVIFASGMGYSGSGAIVAYLSEFNEIETYGNIELRHFQKSYGFINIINNINSKNEFILSIFDFFFNHLLGDFPFVSLEVIRNVRDVRHFRKNFGLDYAKSVYDIAVILSSLIKIYKDDIKVKQYILSTTVNATVEFLRSILSNKQAKYFLFNNCIFAENFHIFSYLHNVNIFCSIRDPRSNYVAQKLEKPGVPRKLTSFIKYYKKMITSIDAICSTLPTDTHLYKIQFEHFVLKENYRKYEVLSKINQNLTHNNKYSKFRPFESVFNLLNYIQYDNAEEIFFLESELSEYCIDIDRYMIMNVLYDCVMENERLSSIIKQKEGKSKPSESNFGLRKYDKFFNSDVPNHNCENKTVVDTVKIINTFNDDCNWYRIYSDGFCEQGGIVVNDKEIPPGKNWTFEVKLPRSYHNCIYNVMLTVTYPNFNNKNTSCGEEINTYSKTKNSFCIFYHNRNGKREVPPGAGVEWRATGFLF